MTEQEQIQQLKTWLKQYGLTILLGIIIAFLITMGWRYWQNYRTKILLHASAVYDEMLTLRAQNNENGAIVQAKKLLSHYPKTPYAHMAAMMVARDEALNKNYAEAINQLKWVIDHSKSPSIKGIAYIRIARILITENEPDVALATLKKLKDKNFIGLADETRGDAYLAQNNLSAAREAYQLALNEIPNAEVTRPLLQMKYDNLAS